jgi:hypothetical protein
MEMDDSGTDLLYHKFVIKVACVVHEAGNTLIHGYQSGSRDPALAQRELQDKLSHPRKDFDYKIGDQIVVSATAKRGRSDSDMNNGPKPRDLAITHIAGTKSLHIEFEIEACVERCETSCPTGGVPGGKDVLSNRWSAEESLDSEFYATRTIEGVLRVNHIDVNPQSFRGLVMPTLPGGYQRVSQRFVTTPDGLTMRYTIRDVQQENAPPPPAVDWDGSHRVSTGLMGQIIHDEITVSLKGAPGTSKKALVAACSRIVFARIGSLGTGSLGKEKLLVSAAMDEQFKRNIVSMRVRVKRVPDGNNNYLNMGISKFGEDFGFYDQKSWPVQFNPASPTGIFAMYVQCPCNDRHGVPKEVSATGSPTTGSTGNQPPNSSFEETSASENPKEKAIEDKTTEQHKQAPYFAGQETMSETTNTGLAPAAISAKGSEDGGQSVSDETLLASNEPSQKMVRLFNATTMRTYTQTYTRVGKPPEVPKATVFREAADGTKEDLQRERVITLSPQLRPDGTLLYRSWRESVYMVREEGAANKDFTVPERQDIKANSSDRTYPRGDVGGSFDPTTGQTFK